MVRNSRGEGALTHSLWSRKQLDHAAQDIENKTVKIKMELCDAPFEEGKYCDGTQEWGKPAPPAPKIHQTRRRCRDKKGENWGENYYPIKYKSYALSLHLRRSGLGLPQFSKSAGAFRLSSKCPYLDGFPDSVGEQSNEQMRCTVFWGDSFFFLQ